MSLKVGTLVIVVVSGDVIPAGTIGTITGALSYRTVWKGLTTEMVTDHFYTVDFPRYPSRWREPPGWGVPPYAIIPITPPGDPVDVKEDQEITA